MTIVTLKDPYFGEFYWHKGEIERGICCRCEHHGQVRKYTTGDLMTTKIMAMCPDCEKEQIVRERGE